MRPTEVLQYGSTLERRLEQAQEAIAHVVGVVARDHCLTPEDILGPSRKIEIANARHITAYILLKTNPNIGYRIVGLGLGRNDHTTVMNSIKRAEELMMQDPELRRRVVEITSTVSQFTSS
jgi:chromosomal replication initiation ATPase DnaA